MDEQGHDLARAGADPRVRARYFAKILRVDGSACWWWTGAISGKGHGRFWVREGWTVIAHRLGWAIAHPGETVPELVGHECDNPLCQRPEHWRESTHALNRAEWVARRETIGSPLRDERGARGRAREIRDGLLAGKSPSELEALGLNAVDRGQLPLW